MFIKRSISAGEGWKDETAVVDLPQFDGIQEVLSLRHHDNVLGANLVKYKFVYEFKDMSCNLSMLHSLRTCIEYNLLKGATLP